MTNDHEDQLDMFEEVILVEVRVRSEGDHYRAFIDGVWWTAIGNTPDQAKDNVIKLMEHDLQYV